MATFIRISLITILLIAAAIIVAGALSMPASAHDSSKAKEPSYTRAGNQYGQYGYTSQQQTQSQANGQTQTAAGGNSTATTGASTSTGGSAVSGPATATNGANTSAINESSTNSGNVTYREAANPVQPATMIISGCQVQGQAGGSTTRAAGMLGIGFTPAQCYDYIQAQAYAAIGAVQAACEILNHTKAALRAVAKGAVLPACVAPAPPLAAIAPGTYTRAQVDTIVKKLSQK